MRVEDKVLIVDDDQIWLRLIKKRFEAYADRFTTLVAPDGRDAVVLLKKNTISLVVTDLQMPEMDGLALLAHLSENYPDIPVIIVTAYHTPKSKKQVLDRGAVGYIEKPFAIENLAEKIIASLDKLSEGGTLQTVPLEMFTQLIEMEQKTCTIRVYDKKKGQNGVLFFRDGNLLEARIRNGQGEEAAYEIFSWGEVVLSIQDTCPVKGKRIQEGLYAVLMESMRRRDEIENGPFEEPAPSLENADRASATAPEIQPAEPVETVDDNETPPPTPKGFPNPETVPKPFPTADIERKLSAWTGGGNPSVRGIRIDKGSAALLSRFAKLGESFGCGALKSCYVSAEKGTDAILVPGDSALRILVDPKCPRDRILQAVSE